MRNKEFGYRVEQSHASGRRYLSTPYIHSGAEYVRGQKNKGDEARLRHLKINAIHLDES